MSNIEHSQTDWINLYVGRCIRNVTDIVGVNTSMQKDTMQCTFYSKSTLAPSTPLTITLEPSVLVT
jgi:hypothetical protein